MLKKLRCCVVVSPSSVAAPVSLRLAALWPAIESAIAPKPVCALCGRSKPRVNDAGVHDDCLATTGERS